MRQPVAAIALLTLSALGSWWLAEINSRSNSEVRKLPVTVDYYSTGVERRTMSSTGREAQFLTATRMTHFAQDDRTELENPRLELADHALPPWIIHAESGTLLDRGTVVQLHGDVLIERAAHAGVGPISVKTTNLRVKPEERYAETADYAELDQPPRHANGIGMQARIADQLTLTLLSKVKTRHDVD